MLHISYLNDHGQMTCFHIYAKRACMGNVATRQHKCSYFFYFGLKQSGMSCVPQLNYINIIRFYASEPN